MLSIRNLFLLFEKIISSIQYDCSIRPLLAVKPIIIGNNTTCSLMKTFFWMVTVHQNSQKYVVMELVFRKAASPVILTVNYLTYYSWILTTVSCTPIISCRLLGIFNCRIYIVNKIMEIDAKPLILLIWNQPPPPSPLTFFCPLLIRGVGAVLTLWT